MLGKPEKTKDPEIIAKEGQLNDISEGIRTGQLDLIQLGSDKKRVTQEIADAKTTHAADLLNAEAESKQKLVLLEEGIEAMNSKALMLYKEIDDLIKEKDDLSSIIKPLSEEYKKQNTLLETIKDSIKTLLSQKTALGDEITSIKTEIAVLTTQKGNLETDIITLSSEKETLEGKVKTQNSLLDTAKDSETISITHRVGHEEKIVELGKQIIAKTEELEIIQTPLSELKKEFAELTSSKEAVLKEINDKKIASDQELEDKKIALQSLEARVDDKIRIFKEYKAKFSVDELARMKINTDLI